jgi:replicative DNA helicase
MPPPESPARRNTMERIPPHNEEAERSVLGAAMLDKDALYDVLEVVRPRDFYNQNHKEIFEGISELARRNVAVDVLTVSEELKKRNVLEMVGGRGYIATLSGEVPTTSNAGEYAKIVAEKAALRHLITTAGDILEKSYEDKMEAEQVLDFAEKSIFEVAQNRQSKDMTPLREILMENLNLIDERSKMKGDLTGVTSGLVDLDSRTNGFQPSDLVIIAARPSMGKTAFSLSVAQQAAIKADAKILFFSLEMSKEQLGQRLLSMEARVDSQKLKTGQLEREEWDRITMALDTLGKGDITIDATPGIRLMEIKNKCRRLKAERGLDMIILDYLQLMEHEGRSESRQQEITAMSRGLKQLAREMNCPILVLSQLSRAPEQRTEHRPILSDLRESGAIEQDADMVLFLYRDEVYNAETTEKPGICEVIIAKNRNGPIGTVEVTWQANYTRFANKSKGG